MVGVDELGGRIVADAANLEGVSISGGEPMEQAEAVLAVLRRIREGSPLGVLLFSGYTLEQIQEQPLGPAILGCVDVLVDGRYDCRQHLGCGLCGSANQRIHLLTGRYRLEEVEGTPPAEVVIGADGSVVASGVASLPIG